MAVLILSTSNNEHADRVGEHLGRRGERALRLNVDLLDLKDLPRVTVSRSQEASISSSINEDPVESIRGVFVHHPIVEVPREGTDELDRTLCRASWESSINWIEQAVGSAMWINKPSQAQRASSLFLQLRMAEECGFRVPETIFTNERQKLEAFSRRHHSIVLKPGNLGGVRIKGYRMLVRQIKVEDVDGETLKNAPCLFQEYVEKAYEMRVHVIGAHVLACKIESQNSVKTSVDWRNYDLRNTPHTVIRIDYALANKCRSVVSALGLRMGILDLIHTPAGDTVFLECNAQGHWIWIEELTGLPITECVCEELLSGSF